MRGGTQFAGILETSKVHRDRVLDVLVKKKMENEQNKTTGLLSKRRQS